jgi:ribonuclease VapC
MVIDSSVLIAILFGEPDREIFKRAIDAAPTRLVSAMTKLESGIVMVGRFGPAGGRHLDDLLRDIAATIVPFTDHHADLARDAFIRFGKGRHKAGLNFGDCASYALAKAEAEPL